MIVKPVEITNLPRENEIVNSILLIMPVNLKGLSRKQLEHFLQMEYNKTAKRNKDVSDLSQIPFAARLLDKIAEIKINTRQAKSIAIYISQDEEQYYCLNYTVDLKIIINEKFSIVTINKAFNKDLDKYLAVLITGCYARIYSASGGSLKRIVALVQETNDYSVDDGTKLNCHISNNIARKKQILSRYIKTIDNTLHLFLDTQPLPVFVLGSHNAAMYFANNSKYRLNIIEIFTTNYTDLNEDFISDLVNLWAKHNINGIAQTTGN